MKPLSVCPKGRAESLRPVRLPKLDAIVGNPPYVRQERVEKNDKKAMQELVASAWSGLQLSGRSDLHCYFWPAATRLLDEGGYFGFLTSSSWLDVEYGFTLQGWMLKHFQIIAIMESAAEPWFPDARVKTCVTILKRCRDENTRMNSLVKFVHFKKKLAEIIGVPAGDDETARQRSVDWLRTQIESATCDQSDDGMRIIVKKQADLWNDGVRAGKF